MKISIKYFLLSLCLHSFLGIAQELPPIQNFSPAEYGAGYQNWSISQSKNKLIYVANNKGLLEFDGSKWQLYPSPNETIMRSVKVIEDRIYTGCYMEFGFWKENEIGILKYTSISKALGIDLVEDEEFWHILEIENRVIFQSLNRIYIYSVKDNGVDIIDSTEDIINIFNVNESIYFQQLNEGIYKIENGKDSLIISDKVFKEDEVINIFQVQEKLLIVTRYNGFFQYDREIEKLDIKGDSFSKMSIYSALQLSNENIALGTISHGIIYLSKKLQVLHQINQPRGLSNNTVLALFEDKDENLWVALDYGISYINIKSPIKVFTDSEGTLGSVYASRIHNNYLYLGTNQGLFCRPINEPNFSFIEGTEGQVWSLSVVDNTLFCGHHKGTFTVTNNLAKLIADIPGTWSISQLGTNSDLIIQGNYDGLYILEKEGLNWGKRNRVEGFNSSARHFEVLSNKIFINHEYKGIFILTVDEQFSKVLDTRIDTLLKGANSSIANYKGDILFTYKNGILVYDEDLDDFIENTAYSKVFTEEDYISGRIVLNESGDKFWVFTKNNIALVSTGTFGDTPKIMTIPITLSIRRDVEEYQNIIRYEDLDQYLLGTSAGYLVINTDQFEIEEFEVAIGKVTNGAIKDQNSSGFPVNKHLEGTFDRDENNFKINFYAPVYKKFFKPYYQFQLTGIYDDWSEWTNESVVFFENLPPGSYRFNVRAKAGEKISTNIASYKFSISKPWYFTNLMLFTYAIAVILFSVMMHNIYRSYYKGQRERLIEKNKRDLELTKLQSEKEIIKLKNEQLKQDYRNKSKELATSTMSVVRKNELLNHIKDHLQKIDDKKSINPVIKIIDKNLNTTKNWELFKEAFDNVDSEFFKNLKSLHPDLSPNDMKLCAYLKLNLSSKEIAPLINISPRSVEIKRYRLRKKLNLNSDDNLATYILNV
jgi:AraC family transcriptional regulator, chitin signaling transcriptional activator